MDDEQRRKAEMARLLATHDVDASDSVMALGYMLSDFLKGTVADAGTAVDTGAGLGSFDLWVTMDGIEHYIEIKKSGNQIAREGPSNWG